MPPWLAPFLTQDPPAEPAVPTTQAAPATPVTTGATPDPSLATEGAGAAGGEASGPLNLLFQVFPLLLIGLIFWFVLIRPERKARKAREALLKSVTKGNQVMTTSGLYGKVAHLSDDTITLEVEDGTRLKFARSAVQTVIGEPDKAAQKSDK